MARSDLSSWTDRLRRTLESYEEPLLREVTGRLLRPRNQWPVDELIERSLTTVNNPAVIDRRLQDLLPAGKQLLALIAHARQPEWRVGNLIEMAVALGHSDGLSVVAQLCQEGLLYPIWPEAREAGKRLKNFQQCFANGTAVPAVFAHPEVAARALGADLGLPELPAVTVPSIPISEADGLEWPLRLAVLWQLVVAGPLRRTQGGTFFKRDLDRLQQDPLLNSPPAESLVDLPDLTLLVVAFAEAQGIVGEVDGELQAATLPSCWDEGLPRTLEGLYTALFRPASWNPQNGFQPEPDGIGNPFPSGYLLTLMLLARQAPDAWIRPADADAWLRQHHPYWLLEQAPPSSPSWVSTFWLGVLYPLRIVQAVRHDSGEWVVRLSPLGRWLLRLTETLNPLPSYTQTLLVQPNLEILAYRQGLTPGLLSRLTRFAAWKGLGPACTLQLQPDTVYRGLETGLTFETILQTLEQHNTRATPLTVVDSWPPGPRNATGSPCTQLPPCWSSAVRRTWAKLWRGAWPQCVSPTASLWFPTKTSSIFGISV